MLMGKEKILFFSAILVILIGTVSSAYVYILYKNTDNEILPLFEGTINIKTGITELT